jgi:hypothetical protein
MSEEPCEPLRHCPRCDQDLPESSFALSARRKRQTYCRQCNTDYMRTWVRENADRKSANRLWTYYRLRPADWQAIWDSQGGRCAICTADLVAGQTAVDHDHRCCPGERCCGRCIRGLLCRKCNTNIGWLEAQPHLDFAGFLVLLRGYADRRAQRVTDLDHELDAHRSSRPARASVPRVRTAPPRGAEVNALDF